MSKDISPDGLLATNLSYYFAYGGRMDRTARRFGLTEEKAVQSIKEWGDRFPALRDSLRNLDAQAKQATVVMDTSMKDACKQLPPAPAQCCPPIDRGMIPRQREGQIGIVAFVNRIMLLNTENSAQQNRPPGLNR